MLHCVRSIHDVLHVGKERENNAIHFLQPYDPVVVSSKNRRIDLSGVGRGEICLVFYFHLLTPPPLGFLRHAFHLILMIIIEPDPYRTERNGLFNFKQNAFD